MFTTLMEDPTPALVVGLALGLVLTTLLLRTGRGRYLYAIVAVAVLTLVAVLVERGVKTERERVEDAIFAVAAALEANDLDAVLSHVAAANRDTRFRATWALQRVQVQDVHVGRLEIAINRLTSPPTANVRLDGVLSLKDRHGELLYERYPGRFRLQLRPVDGRWLITKHEEEGVVPQ